MEVNYFGLVETTQMFLPLIRAHSGRLVNVGSCLGLAALPGASACLKHAFSRNLDQLL